MATHQEAKSFHVLDLCGSPLDNEDAYRLIATLRIVIPDFGSEPEDEAKATMLFAHLMEDGWSQERFGMAIRNFQRQQRFIASKRLVWSIDDFLKCSPEADLHPYEWANDRWHERDRLEGFRIGGKTLWRYRTTSDMPKEFVRIWPV